ncbi:Cell wall protein SED1 [Fusarium oxysporum f. sp. albedinis]|nr:Cell wall protein SED1 [Fusarium oxysporum f. sp. albedinis]
MGSYELLEHPFALPGVCLPQVFICLLSRYFSKAQTKADKSMGYHLNVVLQTAPQDSSASDRRDSKGKSSDRENPVTPLECDRGPS